jgi:hypothetical protein
VTRPIVAALLLSAMALAAGPRTQAREAGENQPPAISSEATTCVRPRARPKVCAFVLDDKGVGQVRAVFRAGGSRPYYWTVMSFDGARYCAWLPAPGDETTAIEYYVEAFDEEYELSRSRSETIEVRADCPLPESPPPKNPAPVRPSGPDQPAAPPGFTPETFTPTP